MIVGPPKSARGKIKQRPRINANNLGDIGVFRTLALSPFWFPKKQQQKHTQMTVVDAVTTRQAVNSTVSVDFQEIALFVQK